MTERVPGTPSGEPQRAAWGGITEAEAKRMAAEVVQRLADSEPSDDTIEAQERLSGTPQESMFCLSPDDIETAVRNAITDAAYDAPHYVPPPTGVPPHRTHQEVLEDGCTHCGAAGDDLREPCANAICPRCNNPFGICDCPPCKYCNTAPIEHASSLAICPGTPPDAGENALQYEATTGVPPKPEDGCIGCGHRPHEAGQCEECQRDRGNAVQCNVQTVWEEHAVSDEDVRQLLADLNAPPPEPDTGVPPEQPTPTRRDWWNTGMPQTPSSDVLFEWFVEALAEENHKEAADHFAGLQSALSASQEENAAIREDAKRWRIYASHLESCVVCSERVCVKTCFDLEAGVPSAGSTPKEADRE